MNTNQPANQPEPATAASAFIPARFSLASRLSIVTLLAMLVTAAVLVLLYRQDQIAEHEDIAKHENEIIVMHLAQSFGDKFKAFILSSEKLDAKALRENPDIESIAALTHTVNDPQILKLKLYNSSGLVVFSTLPDEIGNASKKPEMLKKALAGSAQHILEFRDTFRTPSGEVPDRHIVITYAPLSLTGNNNGVIELYSDFTPNIARVHSKIFTIALVVFFFFAVLYAFLFLFARRTDRDLATWQKLVTDNADKLSQSETRLSMTINSALDAVVSIDATSRVTGFNQAAEGIFGWKREEIIGQSMIELLIPPRHRSDHQNGITRYFQSGEAHILNRRIEITALRRDGSEFPVELSVTPIVEGDHVIFTAYIRDITERKQVEQVRREAFHRLRQITDHVPGMIFQLRRHADGRYSMPFASATIVRMFELSPDEVCEDASALFALCHPDDQDDIIASLEMSAKNLTAWHHEFRIRLEDGTARWLLGDSLPQRETDGSVLWCGYIKDVTDRKQVEQELHEGRAFHRSINEVIGKIGIGLFIVDKDYRVRFMNAVMKEWFGDHTGQICHTTESGASEQHCPLCQLEQVECGNETIHYITTSLDNRIFDIIATPIQNSDGTTSKLEVIRDVTERHQTELELRIAAKAFESQESMFITDNQGVIRRVNSAFTDVTGYSDDEAIGQKPTLLKSGRHDADFYAEIWGKLRQDNYWQGEIWNRRKNGEIFPAWQTITAVLAADGQVTNYISAFSDISRLKNTEDQVYQLAFYDSLTQLPNRRMLLDRLSQALALSERKNQQGALLFIDLDHFKNINDTQGHHVGDQMLIEVAKRMQACIRESDTAARMGGDEFIVLLENLDADGTSAATQASAVAEKIRKAIEQTWSFNGREQYTTASIGITLFRGSSQTTEEMLKRADFALYHAKELGRNTACFFDPALQIAVNARVALEEDLRTAILESQFVLHYQPQIGCNNELTGAEALVRWHHPRHGIMAPADFIPFSEELGLILPVGHWVLETACNQLAAWAVRPEMARLTIAVNVSAPQFRHPEFVSQVISIIKRSGANPRRLKLEITESLLLENIDNVIIKMTSLKALGVSFSLDDFGTGYSSLSYLKRLPLDQLKIDRSFVRDVLTDPNDAAITRTIVALARSMGLETIAEGVETQAQRDFLVRHDCNAFQGYLFGKPVPIDLFDAYASQYSLEAKRQCPAG